jgi:uncharacterized membrane-anchored protein YjiN (DUF445 family)
MADKKPIGRWASLSLLLALGLAVTGVIAGHFGVTFWGGLLLAFGEAALVGGLADWFAVRALFVHPFGIPFPHTALIPRNRPRIVAKIRELVQNEWLPQSLLTAKIQAFDFVGAGLLPILEPLKPRLRDLLATAAVDLLCQASPAKLASFLARGAAQAVEPDKIGPTLANLVARAREQHWLEPLLREWIRKLQEWAELPQSKETIHRRLELAAGSYRDRGWFKNVTYQFAEVLGGVDLNEAADVLQAEIQRFAAEQLAEESQMQQIVRNGLKNVEQRLRDDPMFLKDVRQFILETSDTGTLAVALEPVLESLRKEGLREFQSPDSRLLAWAMRQIELWLAKLESDAALREQVNAWCRRQAVTLVEQHHSIVGALVEEQLNRLSNENLSELIEARVGEDLNWIRLNGTFVGGMVGVALYLLFHMVKWLLPAR